MQTSGRVPLQFRSRIESRAGVLSSYLMFALMAAAFTLLQGCNGNPNPPYVAPTTNNPNPGAQLVSIQITPTTSLIGIGENRQLVATGVYSDGSTNLITSSVTWAVVPPPPPNSGSTSGSTTPASVSVNSSGIATGATIGPAIVTATSGSVVGVLQLIVDANSLNSSTIGILSVPYKSTIVDAGYLPQQTVINGAYAVQELNLDADHFSSSSVIQIALLASIPMPAGYVPNAAAASQSNYLVAVISYTSPDIQIIDASNLSTDFTNNTIVSTFTAPVTQSVGFYAGTPQAYTCIICAAVVNPTTGQLLLSTARGFYSMDMVPTSATFGKFTLLFPATAAAPSPNFSLNPIATPDPYILAPSPTTGEVQVLDLITSAVTTISPGTSGVSTPGAVSVDPLSSYAAVVDAATNAQSLLTLAAPQSPASTPVTGLGVCGAPEPPYLNMVTMAISENAALSDTAHTLFTSQTAGNCVGFEALWPFEASQPLVPSGVLYGYGAMPVTPDLKAFVNGNDANAVGSFNSVYDQGNYALLVDGSSQNNQQWIAKINVSNVLSDAGIQTGASAVPLPAGSIISSGAAGFLCADTTNGICTAITNPTVVYLPTPSTQVTTSVNNINFGSLSVGTSSPPIPVTLANIGPLILNNQISVQGANAGDFALTNSCSFQLQPVSSCTINVIFTPSTGSAESAVLAITGDGSSNPNYLCPSTVEGQTVCLSGTGTSTTQSSTR